MGEGERKGRERKERDRCRKTERMERKGEMVGRENGQSQEKREKRQRKRKQWIWREPERDSYKDRKKPGETQREPEGTERPGNSRDVVWWRVQATELNPRSQGDWVPAGWLFRSCYRLGSGEKGKGRKGEEGRKAVGPRQGGRGRPAAGAGGCAGGKEAVEPRFGRCPRPRTLAPSSPEGSRFPRIGSREEQGDEGRGRTKLSLSFFFFLSIRPIQWS